MHCCCAFPFALAGLFLLVSVDDLLFKVEFCAGLCVCNGGDMQKRSCLVFEIH